MHPSVLNIMHSRNNAWVVLGRKIETKDYISTPEMEAFLQAPLKALNGDDYPGKKETIKYILNSKDCQEHLEELRQGFLWITSTGSINAPLIGLTVLLFFSQKNKFRKEKSWLAFKSTTFSSKVESLI